MAPGFTDAKARGEPAMPSGPLHVKQNEFSGKKTRPPGQGRLTMCSYDRQENLYMKHPTAAKSSREGRKHLLIQGRLAQSLKHVLAVKCFILKVNMSNARGTQS